MIELHGFCGIDDMFLTAPTVDELKQVDLPDLVDMLSKQTIEHRMLIKSEGASFKTIAIKKLIYNIQEAIESKKIFKRSTSIK